MAVYRERRNSTRNIVIALAALIVMTLVVVGVLVARNRFSSPPPDPLAPTREKVLEAAQGLEVFTVEYPQAAQGSELSGALGALARAKGAFESAQADLVQIDAAAVEQIASDFATLSEQAQARASAETLVPLAEKIRAELLELVNLISTPAGEMP
jgi:hypothetical protein